MPFCFEQFNLASLTTQAVAVFPFISTIHVGFGTQLMETTKQTPTINILFPGPTEKLGIRTSSLQTQGEKNESLVN